MSITKYLIFLAILVANTAAFGGKEMTIGDGLIDGARLRPYQLTWRQCTLRDGEWQDNGTLAEELVVIGDFVLRHRQTSNRPDGVTTRSDTYFDRSSFAPLRMEMAATADGNRIAYAERQLTAEGYSGLAIRGEDRKVLGGAISSNMLHGSTMGLPLAAMSYQHEPLEFLASMVGFDATYDVIATWAGREMLPFEGRRIETWLVDVEWHHRESGDVYPPGPDASGGRYWVAPDPPDGFPYVPRYKTDTYAVEFIESVCRKTE